MSNKKFIDGTELVQAGFANGISTQLAKKQLTEGPEARLTEVEKQHIIEDAAEAERLEIQQTKRWRRGGPRVE